MNNEEMNVENVSKKKKFQAMNVILILVGVLCVGIAVHGLYGIYKDYEKVDEIYEDAEEEFVEIYIPIGDISTEDTTEPETAAPEVPKGPWYELATVDVAGLQKKYPDVVGWMLFEDGLISYPVVQAEDNDTYLYTTYNGVESIAGSIFVEATHSGDFSDTHTLIYGHNMKNLSMFGRLKHYVRRAGYYENHKYFQIFHGDEIWRYEIFAYQEVPVDSFVYQEHFTSAKELSNRLLQNSYVNPGLNIKDEDKIITLSTCTTDDNHRLVVSAVLVEKYSVTDKALIED